MAKPVISTASLSCSFGTAPCTYQVLPTNRVTIDGKPAATIMDFAPMVNVASFGMCQSMSNPQVAAATAAAQGVLTPQPCVPVTSSPWSAGASKVTIAGMPALHDASKCMCAWGGQISITNPGATKTTVT